MTTPDAPEPTCETCGYPWGRTVDSEGDDMVHDPRDGHQFKPTDASAPAAPSAASVDELRDRVVRFTIHTGHCRTKMRLNEPCECGRTAQVDALIAAAARVPGGAAGEALEAAREALLDPDHLTGSGVGYEWIVRVDPLLVTAFEEQVIAAARAPGPVGGEALGVHAREEAPTHLFGGQGEGACPYPYADGFCGLLESDHLVVAPSGRPTEAMWIKYHVALADYIKRAEGETGSALWAEVMSLRREIEAAAAPAEPGGG